MKLPEAAQGDHPAWSSHWISTSDGWIRYRRIGTGPLIIALHGIQGTSSAWTQVAGLLAQEYTIVVPDMRGRSPSMSPPYPEAYTLAKFSADLGSLIGEVGQPTCIIGWSMGVLVLFEYLTTGACPPRTMILVGGTAHLSEDSQWFTGGTLAAVAAEASRRADLLNLSMSANPEAVAASWLHLKHSDFREQLKGIGTPTLILHGVEDDQCPVSHGELMARLLPHARLDRWQGVGHNLMADCPVRFANSSREFIKSVDRSV